MPYEEGKEEQNHPKIKGQHMADIIQIGLRILALATSIAAACTVFTSNESTLVFGIPMDAKYSYSSAFKFYAIVTTIASLCSLLSLALTFVLPRIASSKANHHLFFFMHDLVTMSVLLAGCAAATAVGYVGQYGYEHAGWMPICDHFLRFCHNVTAAVVLGYLSFIVFFFLTIINATKSSTAPHHHILPPQI